MIDVRTTTNLRAKLKKVNPEVAWTKYGNCHMRVITWDWESHKVAIGTRGEGYQFFKVDDNFKMEWLG